MAWKDNFKEGKELILATCSKDCAPNANIVISLGFEDNKLLIADCSMVTTIENLKSNPRICVVGGYLKASGSVKVFTSGEYFNKGVSIVAAQDSALKVKSVIVVNIESVFDLENVKRIV